MFNLEKKVWSSIKMTVDDGGKGPNMGTIQAIMDYDTLVIYAFSDGKVSCTFNSSFSYKYVCMK